MMKKLAILIVACGLLIWNPAWAITLVGTPGYGWQSGWVANEAGPEYWDNPSYDGANKNIGFQPFIAGPPQLPYWGKSDGSADTEVYFTSTLPGIAAIKLEISAIATQNTFGIYAKGNTANFVQLFSGAAGPGATVVFDPVALLGTPNFGFYLSGPRGTWYTESSLNVPGQKTHQHFAFFKATGGGYYIAAEDTPFFRSSGAPWSDRDYNDLVVYVVAVPDASTWLLFLSGIPAIALVRRKKSLS